MFLLNGECVGMRQCFHNKCRFSTFKATERAARWRSRGVGRREVWEDSWRYDGHPKLRMKAPLCLAKVGEEISQVEMPDGDPHICIHTEFVADVVQKDVRRLQREGQRTRDDELNLSSVQSLPSYCVK